MDTIIYFYSIKKNGIEDSNQDTAEEELCRIQRLQQKMQGAAYQLIGIGIKMWMLELVRDVAAEMDREESANRKKSRIAHILHAIQRLLKQDTSTLMASQRLRQHHILEQRWEDFSHMLTEIIRDCYNCYCVYEEPVRKLLVDNCTVLPPEFDEYQNEEWVNYLLQYAGLQTRTPCLSHFVILGWAPCVPKLLHDYAYGMRSLQWTMHEKAYTKEVQDFVEDFYQEYGLAISVRLLHEGENFRQGYPVLQNPANILDFTVEDRIPTGGVVRGSVWLDFASLDEKSRRVEERDTGIYYFSLKKQWKQAISP